MSTEKERSQPHPHTTRKENAMVAVPHSNTASTLHAHSIPPMNPAWANAHVIPIKVLLREAVDTIRRVLADSTEEILSGLYGWHLCRTIPMRLSTDGRVVVILDDGKYMLLSQVSEVTTLAVSHAQLGFDTALGMIHELHLQEFIKHLRQLYVSLELNSFPPQFAARLTPSAT